MKDEFKAVARPLSMVLLTFTLCGLAIGHACGYPPPTWFIGFAIPIVSGLMIERAVRKRRNDG